MSGIKTFVISNNNYCLALLLYLNNIGYSWKNRRKGTGKKSRKAEEIFLIALCIWFVYMDLLVFDKMRDSLLLRNTQRSQF